MRRAGVIIERKDAERLADFLLTQGITSRVDEESDGWGVWVHEEQHLAQAKQFLADFLADSNDVRFQGHAKSADEIRQAEQKRVKQASRNMIDPRRRWQGRRAGGFPVTISLIAICVGVAIVVGLGPPDEPYAKWLYFAPVMENPFKGSPPSALEAILGGQVWRLITPIFMHGSPAHLVMNLLMLFQLGALVETRKGSRLLLGLVLATALASNVGQYVMGYYSRDLTPFLGISGVVFGILGYAWMKSRFDASSGIHLPPNFVTWMIVFLAVCVSGLMERIFGIRIANTAHIVGLLTGMAIGYAPIWWRGMSR